MNNMLPLSKIIKNLYQMKIINEKEHIEILTILKIRNLAIHGHVRYIDANMGTLAERFIHRFRALKELPSLPEA